jgi:DNA adenine methylase
MDYTKKSKDELIAICKERKIKGYSTLNKEAIIALIELATPLATPSVTPINPVVAEVPVNTVIPVAPQEVNQVLVAKYVPPTVTHLSPLVKWSGGKAEEIKHILPYMPGHQTYVEPFVGGGALFFYLNPGKAVINDIHPDLVKLYRAIGAGRRLDMKAFMTAHANSEEEYYKVRRMPITSDFDSACQFYYLRKTCFRGMLRYNSSGEFNIPYGKYKTINFSDLDNAAHEQLLQRTTIMSGSFKDVFAACDTPEHFIFLDPPYDSKFTDYGYCSFGRKEQEELAALFKKSKARCMIVIGETDYIKNLYAGYIVHRYPKNYKFKIHSGRVGDEINVNHIVICNYKV